MRQIIEQADRHTLVLVDEIGGGTEPASGAALAIAMLEQFLRAGAGGVVTTHSTELKLFAHQTQSVVNASVRFDPQTFAPTYQLNVGTPGQSLAFPLAASLGIPRDIIERARDLLGTRERDYETALAELSEISARLQSNSEKVQRERMHLQRLQDTVRSRTEALERERRRFAGNAEERLQATLREFSTELARRAAENAAAIRPKVTHAQSALLQKTIDNMHRDLGLESPSPQLDRPARSLHEGDRVRLASLGQEGTVIADNGDTVLVAVGPMRTLVRRDDAHLLAEAARTQRKAAGAGRAGEARAAAVERATAELDVRGKRYIEAEPLVDRWIDEAILAGNSPLRLIHGKGTGMLGRGLQEFLRAHPHVSNVRYGDENEGGGGVTIFDVE